MDATATTEIFADGVSEFLAQGLHELRAGLRRVGERAQSGLFDDAVFEAAYTIHTQHRLLDASRRTFVLELNVARLRGQLSGATPQDRFTSYLALLRDAGYRRSFFAEYEALNSLLTRLASDVAGAICEFAERLASDARDLGRLVDDAVCIESLQSVTMTGDPHRRARCVMIATFAGNARIVYKPRSLATEAVYSELVDWLNARGQNPPLRAARVLDRGGYGWMQFVPSGPCRDAAAVRRFYRRHGTQLALLSAVEATDLHLENVIACDEWPVLVDLEAVGQPHWPSEPAPRAAEAIVSESVVRVGLLPNGGAGACGGGVDRSGLGGAAGQRSETAALVFVDAGTDTMRAVETYPVYPSADNVPTLDGAPVEAWRHASEIASGFTSTYRRLLANRDELLAGDGPIARLAAAHVRVIVRATAYYGTLLNRSRHPNALRTDRDHDAVFAHLSRAVDASPHLARLIDSEIADLRRGDTPVFSARANGTALRDGSGRVIPGVLTTSPLDAVIARIRSLSNRDLARQVAILRGAMATAVPVELVAGTPQGTLRPRAPRSGARRSSAAPLRWSRRVARRLVAMAVDPHDSPEWIAPAVGDGGRWRLAPIGNALYDGRAGIALFLAYHAAVCQDADAARLARRVAAALVTLADSWNAGDDSPSHLPGAFTGAAGVVYTLAHLGHLWSDERLHDTAAALALRIAGSIAGDTRHDVLAGAAGVLKCILALHACRGTPELLAAASACGEALVAHSQRMPAGVGWIGPHSAAPLAGYSHGASGIAASLLRLASVSPNTDDRARYRDTAIAALAYERSLYVAAAESWPDLRPESNGSSSFAAWCHGAAGIALARHEALQHLDDPRLPEERAIALRTTLRNGYSRSHSLCHGVAGNLDIVTEIARTAGTRWRHDAEALAASLADSVGRHDIVCGTPNGIETPGLMTGIAGVAYGQLRLAAPSIVPNILSLEAPRVSRPQTVDADASSNRVASASAVPSISQHRAASVTTARQSADV